MSQSPIKEFLAKSVSMVPVARLGSNSNKNEIKISAEGVAKLTFSFLDDHHADSSLEPGEVKTPPRATNSSPSPSPLSLIKEVTPSHLPEVAPVSALHNESTSMAMKRTKTTSQSDAQACQEKVRAILELDAIKRREEAEKKKQQIKGAKLGSDIENKESKRKAKEEKKRLKKIKREERKAALELYSEDEEDGTKITILTKMKKKKRDKESYSSEEEGENHDDDDDDLMCSNTTPIPLSATPRYAVVSAGPLPPHLSPFPDQFIGFRPMNPFMRMPRPDFHHQRGSGFHMRGRGGMRGTLRFPSFRAPFHGSGPPRHIHIMPRQQTPPPARGHSPILAPPSDNLIWTTTKPSISYAFNTRDTSKIKLLSKPVAKELSPATKTESTQNFSSQSSESTIRKKSKKSREHQKKQRSMRNSSEKLSKRKVDKVRKNLRSSSDRKRTKTPEIDFLKADSKTVRKQSKEVVESCSNKNPKLEQASDESEEMWDADELQEPLTSTPPQPSSPGFELIKDPLTTKNSVSTRELNIAEEHISKQKIKSESNNGIIIPEGPALPPQIGSLVNETSTDTNNLDQAKNFDMFADSPPRPLTPPISGQDIDKLLLTARKAADSKTEEIHIKLSAKIENKHVDIPGGSTPPKSLLKESSSVELEKSSVQKAIEIQSQMNAQQESVLKSSKTKKKSLREENSALLKAIEAKNRINKLLNEDLLESPSTSKIKSKSVADVQKTSLQKAIEVQSRIDELLKDDDLDPSAISKIKAKSLEHKLQKEKEAQSGSKLQSQKHEKPMEKLQSKARRSFTPELYTARPKNPFKRSISREQQKERRSRSRTPKRDLHTKRTIFDKHRNELGRSKSRIRGGTTSFNRSGSNSFNRSHSAEKDREHSKRLRLGVDTKFNRLRSPRTLRGASKETTKSLTARGKEMSSRHRPVTSLTPYKKKNRVPLSFTAAEFLFPEGDEINEDDNSKSSSQKVFSTEDDTTSSEKPRNRSKKSKSHKDDSPDTDDYIDNWENDDVDLDINSNNACDSSTPIRSSSQEEVEEEKFVARFVNPSPPLFLQSLKEATTKDQQMIINLSKTQDVKNTKAKVESDQQVSHEPTQKKELFGMQEIYDQFIKSVEESGVDLKSTESNKKPEDIPIKSVSDKHEDNLSTSSTSTSSTSSSSCSSSSEASNSSTSSYSSSSSSASSSEDSNDADCFKNITLDSPKPKPKEFKTNPMIVVKIEEKTLTPPLPADKSVTPERQPLTIADITKATSINTYISPSLTNSKQLKTTPVLSETKTKNSAAPTATVKTQKSDVAKDFKKLKSLEANLSRIQMMRANYDSADEISDELLKMEKLFLHEKNLILQKYAKSSKSTVRESDNSNSAAPLASSGQFVASLQQTGSEIEQEAATIEANKIFDANREAIKLTISPLKLPRTPVIFSKATTNVDSESHPTEPDEPDFTEKLQKPAKEVAIVKPMMETKELRSSQTRQHRRSTPPRTRSPSSGYHRERRRSISRSRYSPQQRRQQRGRSLSVSPPPRRSGAPARYLSPARRGVSNAFSTSQSRNYRNSGRRSRSRSRSISRQGNRRVNERSRRATATTPVGHSQPHYRKSTTQQRSSTRDSRSRSRTPPRSPPIPRSPPRPHSPRSSPSSRRSSYSRERYSSRSPLPFKPPSPPMRRSLSPNLQRRLSLSPEKRPRDSSAICRSRSHSRSRSPSTRYDNQRRHRSSSYDRRSPSLQSQYFLQDSSNGTASPASSYYYNLSPNRISLDARINIVLNGPPNQEGNNASFDSYSNYSQYGGQYMSIPPQPDTTTYGINYGTNQYVPMSSSDLSHPTSLTHQQVYSNIPTIGGGGISGTATPTSVHSNYYYNEFSGHTNAHQSSSVLKELPKATVAVQKGNVLEIVPSAEMSERSDSTTTAHNDTTTSPIKQVKAKKTLSWKEEVNNRHVTAAVLRLSRENESLSKGILKKSALENVSSNEDQTVKKKVYFEDGIFPNRESDDEDRKIIDSKLRRKLRRLHKHHGITINAVNLVKQHKSDDDKITDPELENAVPPPPPPGTPATHLEQPIYLRPPSPAPLFYFHFDSVVHSMYVSQLERPIPPRLLNPKAVPPAATGPPAQSPSNTPSPNGAVAASAAGAGATASGTTNLQSSKKELSALAALNRSNRSSNNERSSPKILLPTSTTLQRQANIKTLSIDATHSETLQTTIKNSFHALSANVSTTLPASHMIPPITPMPPQRQSSPIGFMGMRINNFMRLPPSPLARHGGSPLPTNNNGNGPAMAIIGMRHSFNMPPPSMMPPHILPSPEFSPQQQQHYNPMSHPNSPHMHHLNQPYPVVQAPMPHSHQHPHPHFPPTGSQAPPHHMYHHHHRHQSPQFYMQSLPPPPPLPPPSRHTYVPPPDTAPPVGEETNAQLPNSPQAMVSPYNIQRQ